MNRPIKLISFLIIGLICGLTVAPLTSFLPRKIEYVEVKTIEYVKVIEYRETVVEIVEYVEVIEYVEVTKYKELRNFNSSIDLRYWLASDNTSDYEYVEDSFDCDDFAKMLQLHAEADGWRLNFVVIGDHALNSACIEDRYYLIEPQTNEVTYIGKLD